jgi:hypothetical protein
VYDCDPPIETRDVPAGETIPFKHNGAKIAGREFQEALRKVAAKV